MVSAMPWGPGPPARNGRSLAALDGAPCRHRLGEDDHELVLGIGPIPHRQPPARTKQGAGARKIVFVAVFGVNRLARAHREAAAVYAEEDAMGCLQVHLDARFSL